MTRVVIHWLTFQCFPALPFPFSSGTLNFPPYNLLGLNLTKDLNESDLFGRDTDGEVGQCGRERESQLRVYLPVSMETWCLMPLRNSGISTYSWEYYGEHTSQSFHLKSVDSGIFVCQFPANPQLRAASGSINSGTSSLLCAWAKHILVVGGGWDGGGEMLSNRKQHRLEQPEAEGRCMHKNSEYSRT